MKAYHVTVTMWHDQTERLEKAPDESTAVDQFIDRLLGVFGLDSAEKLGIEKIDVKQLPDVFCEAIQ